MPSESVRHGLPFLLEGQASQEVYYNKAALLVDALLALSLDSTASPGNAPPGSPVDGTAYLVGSSPTGAWAGQAGKIAVYQTGWYFTPKVAGMIAWDRALSAHYRWNGSAWAAVGGSTPTETSSSSVLGSTYSITSTNAWENAGFSVTLSAGTYLLQLDVRGVINPSGANGAIDVRLYDTFGLAAVADSERRVVWGLTGTPNDQTAPLAMVVTFGSTVNLRLEARRSTGPSSYTTSQIASDANGRTTFNYVKLS